MRLPVTLLAALRPRPASGLLAILAALLWGYWLAWLPPRPRCTFPAQPSAIYFSPDSQKVLLPRGDGALWDLRTARKLATPLQEKKLLEHALRGCEVAFAPDSRSAAAVIEEGVILWDVATSKVLATYPRANTSKGTTHAEFPACLSSFDLTKSALSGDGKVMVEIDTGPMVKVWDTASGNGKLLDPKGRFLGTPALSPDGRFLALHVTRDRNGQTTDPLAWLREWLGCEPGPEVGWDIKLYEMSTGRELGALPAGTWPSFAPDGRTLAVVWVDDNFAHLRREPVLQIWDLPLRKSLGQLLGQCLLAGTIVLLLVKAIASLHSRWRRHPVS